MVVTGERTAMDRDEERDLEERMGGPTTGEGRPSVGTGGVASIDDVLSALSDPKRRAALRALRDSDVATVEELATTVAARTEETPRRAVDDEAYERTKVELTHVHLPALAEEGFVEFDPRSSTVRYGDPPRNLEAVLRLVEELEEARDG